MRLSYSKLNDYENCPKKFYLTHIAGHKLIPNKYMLAGMEIHNILYESTQVTEWKNHLLTHPKYMTYKAMIDNYIGFQENAIKVGADPKPAYAEYKIVDDKAEFSLKIDRIDKWDGKILLSDYKSDEDADMSKHLKQLFIYVYFYNKHHKDKITHVGVLFIKKTKKIKSIPVTQERINEAMNWLVGLKKIIDAKGRDEKEYPATPNGWCKNCTHYLSGICAEGRAKYGTGNIIELSEDEMS